MSVYADVLFLINSVSAYIMLYILGKIINNFKIQKKRILLASMLGGLAATVIFCTEVKLWIAYFLRITSVLAMLFISFFEVKRQIAGQLVYFTLMTGIMVFSTAFAASILQNTFPMVMKAGIIYFGVSPKIFAVSFAVSYLVMTFFVRVFKNRQNKKYYTMYVTHNDKTLAVSALLDSGNNLKEPLTGKCVSIAEWDEVKELFDVECDFSQIENYADKMKLWAVPFHSIGNKNGILLAFAADNVRVENKSYNKSFIGIYGGKLSKNGEYHALINAGLL